MSATLIACPSGVALPLSVNDLVAGVVRRWGAMVRVLPVPTLAACLIVSEPGRQSFRITYSLDQRTIASDGDPEQTLTVAVLVRSLMPADAPRVVGFPPTNLCHIDLVAGITEEQGRGSVVSHEVPGWDADDPEMRGTGPNPDHLPTRPRPEFHSFLISHAGRLALPISADVLVRAATRRWGEWVRTARAHEGVAVDVYIEEPGRPIYRITLHTNGSMITCDGDDRQKVEVAVWVRTLILDDFPRVITFDRDWRFHVDLVPGMTEDDFRAAMVDHSVDGWDADDPDLR